MWHLGLIAMAMMTTTNGHVPTETKAEKSERMRWWHQARFGMFIHWGLYSVPAGEYGGKTGYAEWLMESAHVPVEEYEKYRAGFNPVKFDPKEWAKMAHDAGMKYVVITTKHHDGFALFDSKAGPYNITSTPYKKDIMRELSTAVRSEGLKMCWYHSIMDWHHPDYFPARAWNPRAGKAKTLDAYNKYLRQQVTELLTNYGPIGVMWFDGEWERSWNDHYGKPLYDLCRTLQPNVIVNNRVSNSRAGEMGDATSGGVGDFTTPEQTIPATGLPGVDWETCMTMNDNWGYNSHDQNWKSSATLIRNLVDVVSKGGNYLLNIGPKADGTFPEPAVERLRDIGRWMDVNSETIYGTEASVFDSLPWGKSTTKYHPDSTTLYLHIFNVPDNGKLIVPGLASAILGAKILGVDEPIKAIQEGPNVSVSLPNIEVTPFPVVVKLEVAGKPIVYRSPKLSVSSPQFVNAATVTVESGSESLEVRYTTDGSDPTPSSRKFMGPIKVDATCTLRAAAFHENRIVSDIVSAPLEKVSPWQASSVALEGQGLRCEEYQGDWDRCPDWSKLTATKKFVGKLGFPESGGVPIEFVGRHYTGYIRIPHDDAYSFALSSDDGSNLLIDGKLVVDNDGAHSTLTKTGNAPLATGLHKIDISWFNKTGGAELKLAWGLAGGPLTPVSETDLAH